LLWVNVVCGSAAGWRSLKQLMPASAISLGVLALVSHDVNSSVFGLPTTAVKLEFDCSGPAHSSPHLTFPGDV
jgi:hypothetical protein